MSLNVVIIDDHPLVAEGIGNIIQSIRDNTQVTSVHNIADELDKVIATEPDLILLDLNMPKMDGFEVLGELTEKLLTTAIVVISSSKDKADMQKAIALGAMGFIPKSAPSPIIYNALNLVLSGGVYIPPEMLAMDIDEPQTQPSSKASNLTPRQIEVLILMSKGCVNKEIARELDCAETTVKAHVTAIFRELNAKNRTEAVVNAQQQGLLT